MRLPPPRVQATGAGTGAAAAGELRHPAALGGSSTSIRESVTIDTRGTEGPERTSHGIREPPLCAPLTCSHTHARTHVWRQSVTAATTERNARSATRTGCHEPAVVATVGARTPATRQTYTAPRRAAAARSTPRACSSGFGDSPTRRSRLACSLASAPTAPTLSLCARAREQAAQRRLLGCGRAW